MDVDMDEVERMEEQCVSEAEWMDRNEKIVIDSETVDNIVSLEVAVLVMSLVLLYLVI